VIATVAPEMEGNATMRSVLLDHKRRWQSMFELSGPFRKLIVQRRLELIDSLFPMPSSAAVSAPG
jgi:hypothetical protein